MFSWLFYRLWADSWKTPTMVIITINIPTDWCWYHCTPVVCLCHSYETASQAWNELVPATLTQLSRTTTFANPLSPIYTGVNNSLRKAWSRMKCSFRCTLVLRCASGFQSKSIVNFHFIGVSLIIYPTCVQPQRVNLEKKFLMLECPFTPANSCSYDCVHNYDMFVL